MSVHLEAELERRAALERALAAERDTARVLEEAARVVADPADQQLCARLLDVEGRAHAELQREEDRLEAEDFVEKAIDV